MREHPDYYYNQSAVIPFRRKGEDLKILMISSRKKKRWVIPKGIIEPELSPADSAAKEALEEAGIEGRVIPDPIGSYQYEKWGGVCTAQVFVMAVEKVLDQWEESFRDRVWLPLPETLLRVKEPELKKIIKGLPKFLGEHGV